MAASTSQSDVDSPGSGEEEDLRAEITRLQQQVQELSRPKPEDSYSVAAPQKSGYLFKWQDRSIGWGGTKWGLRYVRLENGRLSYYKTHEERSPRYVLTLKDCAVRDDGSKVNRRNNTKKSSEDASEMEVGSHYYVFSVYQRPSKVPKKTEVNIFGGDDDDKCNAYEDEIIPLLRFSTQSQAEKNQWIELISQSCAYCDSEEFDRQSSAKQQDATKSQEGRGRNKGGTLSKLVFEEVEPRSIARKPSGYKLKEMGENFRTKTKDDKAARSNNIQYPPSKPMHRQASPSYLSKESAHTQNYRGLFNLGMIVLVVSNYRLLIDSVRKHGFIMNELSKLNHDYLKASLSDKLFLFPVVSGLSIVQVIIFQVRLSQCAKTITNVLELY